MAVLAKGWENPIYTVMRGKTGPINTKLPFYVTGITNEEIIVKDTNTYFV